jgi:outer membrane protein W
VTVFGRPQTTFSREPAATEAELQRLFVKYESDLRKVLELAEWGGDADDLFAAVRSGGAAERSMPAGTEFEWMAFRKRGQPACVKNIIWKGKSPFPAWSIAFESNGYSWELVVPKTCLNLSIVRGTTRAVPPPTCDLSASFDPASDMITVRGSTSGAEIQITSVREPGGGGDLGRLKSAGDGVWTYPPSADGRYSFTANARHESGSQNTDCSAVVQVERRKPKFVCVVTVDPDTGMVRIDTSGSVGEVSLTGVTLPDGSAGDSTALGATFDPSASLPKKPGDYTYTFSGVARLNAFEDAGSCSATVEKKRRAAGASPWILRLYGAGADSSGDSIMTGPVRSDPSDLLSPFVTTKRTIGDGNGFGLGLERLVGARLGVELDALFLDLDGNRVFDFGDDWTMTNPGVGMDAVSLGLNYHLTPDKMIDVFVGPFVSAVDYSDSGFNVDEPKFGSEIGVGAKLGADFYFGSQSPWALSTSIRYLAASAGDDANEFDVDPLIGTIGIGYRF